MRGCLFTLAVGAVALAAFVVIALPAIFAGAITAGVGAAGLSAADTVVTVSSDPPTDLVGLHADRVRIRATQATFRGMRIGSVDIALGDVGLVDRSVGVVDGELDRVVVPDVGGADLPLDQIALSGGGDAIVATTVIAPSAAKALLADAVEAAAGARPAGLAFAAPDRLTATLGGASVSGRLAIATDGDLVVRVLDGPRTGDVLTILRAGEDLPIRLTSVTVTAAGALRLVGELTIGLLG